MTNTIREVKLNHFSPSYRTIARQVDISKLAATNYKLSFHNPKLNNLVQYIMSRIYW